MHGNCAATLRLCATRLLPSRHYDLEHSEHCAMPQHCTACRHNTHVVISVSGTLTATYRKVHLFDVEIADGPVLRESSYTAPGTQVRIVCALCVYMLLPFLLRC